MVHVQTIRKFFLLKEGFTAIIFSDAFLKGFI